MAEPSVAAQEGAQEVFRTSYGEIVAWVTELLGQEDLARAITVEAFATLVDEWGGIGAPRQWLFVQVTDEILTRWRRRPPHETAPDTDGRPRVREVVSQLPERLRGPVLLHYFAGLTVEQVARGTKRTTAAVTRDLAHAHDLVRPLVEATA